MSATCPVHARALNLMASADTLLPWLRRMAYCTSTFNLFARAQLEGASRTPLAEVYVNEAVAGKRGSTNKFHYRPFQSSIGATGLTNNNKIKSMNSQSKNRTYTEINHNDNPFIVRILPLLICKGCGNRQQVMPYDLVLEHKERHCFPVDGDWKKKQETNKEASRYYHTDIKCIMERFLYFTKEYIEISSTVKASLLESHKVYLNNVFFDNLVMALFFMSARKAKHICSFFYEFWCLVSVDSHFE